MQKLAVYLPTSRYLNEATSFYIDMICEGISGEKPHIVHTLVGLNKFDLVFVIDAKSFIFVKLRYPSLNIITWYQGIVPEEALMILESKARYVLWSILEFFALRYSYFNIFVSRAMKEHYRKKYGYKKNKDIIIPCFNKELNKDIEVQGRGLSFVYAGSLHKWQCVDRMLSIFRYVQLKEPQARLDFFTFNTQDAKNKIDEYGLENVRICTVGLDDIDKAISKNRYGFLIRDDHVVNNVATPTKLSTYMSVGTKPILTNVIYDFNASLDKDSCIYLDKNDSDIESADKILEDFYKKQDDYIFISCRVQIFDDFFNKKLYIDRLKKIFK